jgi:hypothetical protein
MHMHDLLHERAAELSRLATTVRTNLGKAEALIPVVNEQLSELAGLCNVSSVNHRYGPDRSERSELRAGPYRLPG